MKTVEKTLQNLVKEALAKAFDHEAEEVHIEVPGDRTHGDYATNVALTLASVFRKNPLKIAQDIVEELPACDTVEKVEVKPPGFINFFIDKSVLLGVVKDILTKGRDYGKGEKKSGHINIEYVSANPTGSLHVGHARGAAAGDALARIMKKAGFRVTREFYVNDGGNQIEALAQSIAARYAQLFQREAEIPADGYHGKEIKEIAARIKAEHGDRFLEEDGREHFRTFGVGHLMRNMQEDLAAFRVAFDVFASESTLYEKGEVEKTLETLKNAGFTYEKDGALFLRTTLKGDEKDRVIVKSDKTYTYLLPDIAYHKNKLERGYDKLVDILGGDHHGYIPRLKAGVEMVTGKKGVLEIDILQMVRVLQNGEELKLSKRSGKAITLRDLIDAVGTDAVRYFFAQHSLNTHMDLDLDLAIRQSNENPVYYAQYAHARICSIFRKAEEKGLDFDLSFENFRTLSGEKTFDLVERLAWYPTLIQEAAQKRIFHKIPAYIHRLAQSLHSFYGAVIVLSENKRERSERLMLLEAVRIVIADALALVGVDAPEKM